MEIRHYQKTDFNACLALFRANMPRYFDPREEAEFSQFLLDAPENYFVLRDERELRACGGYALAASGDAYLAWGMVKPEVHRSGYGSKLLSYRLERLKDKRVLLDTSQHTFRFFEKFGFKLRKITPSGYGPGLDRYDMILESQQDG